MTNTTPIATTPTNVLEYFEQNKLTPNDLDIEVNYFINEFLIEQTVSMIFASAGQGKSFLVLAIAIRLLQEGKISKCLYLDMDNSTMALKSRSLDELLINNIDLIYIHHSKTNANASELLFQLGREVNIVSKSLLNHLIVIDSIRDFVGGRDMNSDKDIMPIMENLKKLREAGATIIFLHHTKKDSDGGVYKGSTSFLDSVDVAYKLESEKESDAVLRYSLSVYKDRIPVNNTSFKLNTKTFALRNDNYAMNQLSKHEQAFINLVKEALEANSNGINQTNLLKKIGTSNSDKTSRNNLDKFSGQFWIMKHTPTANNSKNYYPLMDTV